MSHEKSRRRSQKDCGVLMDKSIHIRINKKPSYLIYLTMIHFIIIITNVLSSIYCLITSMQIEVNHRLFVSFTMLFCVVLLSSMTLKNWRLTVIPSELFVLILLLWEDKESILQGIYRLENIAVKAINQYFSVNLPFFLVEQYDDVMCITKALLVIAFILSFLLICSLVLRGLKYLFLLISIACYVLPCIVGMLPDERIFIIYAISLVSLVGLLFTNGNEWMVYQKNERNNNYIRVFLGLSYMLVAVISLSIASVFLSEERYEKLPIVEWKEVLQTQVKEVELPEIESDIKLFPKTFQSIGGLSGGRLDVSNGVVKYNHSKQLLVTMAKPSYELYLKGFTGVNYEGTAWTAAKADQESFRGIVDEMQKEQITIDEYTIRVLGALAEQNRIPNDDIISNDVTIEYKKANRNYLYYPYYTWFGGISQDFTREYNYHNLLYHEGYVIPEEKNSSYILRTYSINDSESFIQSILDEIQREDIYAGNPQWLDVNLLEPTVSLNQLSEIEDQYRKYVYDVYLSLPEDRVDHLIQETLEYKEKLDTGASKSSKYMIKAVEYVRDYLWERADYSLAPGKTPKGEDYIEYFLYENHKGYCAHYASAATIMLRVLRIPARYVEGYYINEDMINEAPIIHKDVSNGGEQIQVTVEDVQAHSWVEIYIDGFGWLPLEFTEPTSGEDNTNLSETAPSITQSPEITAQPTKEPENLPENNLQTDENVPSEQQGAMSDVKKEQPIPTFLLFIIAAPLAVVCFFVLFHKYRVNVWSKYLRKYNETQIIILWIQKLEKLINPKIDLCTLNERLSVEKASPSRGIHSILEFDASVWLRDLYLKAVYSNEPITNQELKKAQHFLTNAYTNLYEQKMKLWQIWYRFYIPIKFEI